MAARERRQTGAQTTSAAKMWAVGWDRAALSAAARQWGHKEPLSTISYPQAEHMFTATLDISVEYTTSRLDGEVGNDVSTTNVPIFHSRLAPNGYDAALVAAPIQPRPRLLGRYASSTRCMY